MTITTTPARLAAASILYSCTLILAYVVGIAAPTPDDAIVLILAIVVLVVVLAIVLIWDSRWLSPELYRQPGARQPQPQPQTQPQQTLDPLSPYERQQIRDRAIAQIRAAAHHPVTTKEQHRS